MHKISRILVCVDGSPNSLRAAEMAGDMAKRYSARVDLLFVVGPAEHSMLGGKEVWGGEGENIGDVELNHAIEIVKNAGVEAAAHNININAIAQNWTTNPTSFTPEIMAMPDFPERLREVPAGRLAHGWESAALALYLAGEESNFFFGQVFPFAGGWQT